MPIPAKPANFEISAEYSAVTLTFDALDATPDILRWEYRRKPAEDNTWGDWTEISGTSEATTEVVLSSQPGGGQEYQIRAVNTDGNGATSDTRGVWIMAVKGALNSTFGISSTSVPSTIDESNYEGITFTDCGEVTNIGDFGREYQVVEVNNLADGATRKFKGSYNNGSFQVELLFDSADAGQTLLETAADSTATYLFKVGLPGDGAAGEEFYFSGLVTSLKRQVGGPNSAIMLNANIEIDHRNIIEGT